MMMLYSCHPEVMMAIQRWLVDSLRASVGLKRSHDVRRESISATHSAVDAHDHSNPLYQEGCAVGAGCVAI